IILFGMRNLDVSVCNFITTFQKQKEKNKYNKIFIVLQFKKKLGKTIYEKTTNKTKNNKKTKIMKNTQINNTQSKKNKLIKNKQKETSEKNGKKGRQVNFI